jgi:uncharacterized small protein (DUF1192 family)
MLLLWVCILFVHADDLTTRDGTVYKDFKALGHDDGYLTIMYADGGGKIPLSNLPDALQKQYDYDPAKAAAAVKAASDADKAQALAVAQAQTQTSIANHVAAEAPSVTPASSPVHPGASLPVVNADAIRSQIAALQEQIAQLQKQVTAEDAQDSAQFNSAPNVYSNERGQAEHHYTESHSQTSVDDRAQIAHLQDQIAALQAQLNGGVSAPAAPLSPSGANPTDSLVNGAL